MALDFTNIKDEPGAAIICIHDGSDLDEKAMIRLIEGMRQSTTKQILLMSAKDSIAMSIIEFYGLKGSHFILIVTDDDQLNHVWSDGENFNDPQAIAFVAEQAG